MNILKWQNGTLNYESESLKLMSLNLHVVQLVLMHNESIISHHT